MIYNKQEVDTIIRLARAGWIVEAVERWERVVDTYGYDSTNYVAMSCYLAARGGTKVFEWRRGVYER